MRYQHMDHAGWVENNIAAAKRMMVGKKQRADVTKGWAAAPDKLSDFEARVMDILGMVYGGIYNAPIGWDRVEWQAGRGILLPVRDDRMSTFDFAGLTYLVFLCHEARIRCDISVASFGRFSLMFHPRRHDGGMGERHPNLDEAVAAFRSYLPADHRIVYRAAASVEQAA